MFPTVKGRFFFCFVFKDVFIHLFGCARSLFQHAGSLVVGCELLIVLQVAFSSLTGD